ncbi:MAG: cobyrinate a,c-diamide synthase [Pseudomonadota bacterium]
MRFKRRRSRSESASTSISERIALSIDTSFEASTCPIARSTSWLNGSDGTDSNAAIAKLLGQKVLLVVDCRGMHRTIAALINGLQQFDTDVQFAGVILNRIRSARHGSKVRTAIAEHTSLQVLGEIPETDSVHIAEKQLGLVPAPEFHNNTACIESIAAVVRDHVNVESLFSGVARAPQQTTGTPISAPAGTGNATLTIGIAKDEAFHFYYHDDLEALRNRGVTLREVSPLHDDFPADLDGLLIGGGFPERHAAALQSNAGFRQALKSAIEAGLPVHAECGGLMYLCNSLQIDKHSFAMVGIFDAEVAMLTKPVGRGYVRLRRLADNAVIAAHEFHHSKAHFNTPQPFTHMVERGYGIDGNHDGVSRYNAHASYAHVRHTQRTPWVDEFLALVQHSAYQQPANAGVAR